MAHGAGGKSSQALCHAVPEAFANSFFSSPFLDAAAAAAACFLDYLYMVYSTTVLVVQII